MFVKLATRFESKVEVVKGNERVDGKSILGILTLAAAEGTTLSIEAAGPDAQEALDARLRWSSTTSPKTKIFTNRMQKLQGIAVSPGVVIGEALVMDNEGFRIPRRFVARDAVEEELERLGKAIARRQRRKSQRIATPSRRNSARSTAPSSRPTSRCSRIRSSATKSKR